MYIIQTISIYTAKDTRNTLTHTFCDDEVWTIRDRVKSTISVIADEGKGWKVRKPFGCVNQFNSV